MNGSMDRGESRSSQLLSGSTLYPRRCLSERQMMSLLMAAVLDLRMIADTEMVLILPSAS